jgi:hypothetical protein
LKYYYVYSKVFTLVGDYASTGTAEEPYSSNRTLTFSKPFFIEVEEMIVKFVDASGATLLYGL